MPSSIKCREKSPVYGLRTSRSSQKCRISLWKGAAVPQVPTRYFRNVGHKCIAQVREQRPWCWHQAPLWWLNFSTKEIYKDSLKTTLKSYLAILWLQKWRSQKGMPMWIVAWTIRHAFEVQKATVITSGHHVSSNLDLVEGSEEIMSSGGESRSSPKIAGCCFLQFVGYVDVRWYVGLHTSFTCTPSTLPFALYLETPDTPEAKISLLLQIFLSFLLGYILKVWCWESSCLHIDLIEDFKVVWLQERVLYGCTGKGRCPGKKGARSEGLGKLIGNEV